MYLMCEWHSGKETVGRSSMKPFLVARAYLRKPLFLFTLAAQDQYVVHLHLPRNPCEFCCLELRGAHPSQQESGALCSLSHDDLCCRTEIGNVLQKVRS